MAEVGLGFRDMPVICVNVDGYYQPFSDMVLRARRDTLLYKRPEMLMVFEPDAKSALQTAVRQVAAVKTGPKQGGAPKRRPRSFWRDGGDKFLMGAAVGAAGLLALQFLLKRP